MDAYNSIFEINFHKINQNCGNLPESFWVDKFHPFFARDQWVCEWVEGVENEIDTN